MKYNELNIKKSKNSTRVGRGISAGKGKTAGRGTKGQGSRKSGGTRPGFEGGQMPLYMRIPKLRGFKSIRPKAEVVYTGDLANLKILIDNTTLFEAGLISSAHTKVKLVSKGELRVKKDVKLQGASVSAIEAIKKAGGTYSNIERLKRQSKKSVE